MPEPIEQHMESTAARGLRGEELVRFINDVLPEIHPRVKRRPQVKHDTPLFEDGRIDSLAIVHLMAFIEETTGRRIPPRMVVMKHFRSVDAICAAFGEHLERSH
jgi:acyl carrier protein